VGAFKLSFRWEDRRGRRCWRFTVPSDKGEIRGEADDSLMGPAFEVQHCVVEAFTGRIVISPTRNEEKAEELAARLNAAQVDPPGDEVG